MRRLGLVFASALTLLGAASAAHAIDKDVARRVALGGSCQRCQFSGRQLVGARFFGSDFDHSALVGTDLRRPGTAAAADILRRFTRANLQGATVQGSDFEGSAFNNAAMSGLEGQGSNFSRAVFNGAQLKGAEMQGANLADASAVGADFTSAEMQGAILAHGRLRGAVFRSAELQGARFEGADLTDADFHNAELTGADLRGSDWSAVRGLTQDQLQSACTDGRTRLPAGLHAVACQHSYDHGGAPRPPRPPAPPTPPREP